MMFCFLTIGRVELMDLIIVLHSKAVKTFCSPMHFSLRVGCSAAARPVGRVVEADSQAGDKGSGMCYTYSCSKGIFGGRFWAVNSSAFHEELVYAYNYICMLKALLMKWVDRSPFHLLGNMSHFRNIFDLYQTM